jgi:uncharacterized membrane protein
MRQRLSTLTRWVAVGLLAGFGTGAIGQSVQSFLYSNGTFTTIEAPDAFITYAKDINARNIVGTVSDSKGLNGFLYANGTFTHIIVPGAVQTHANGVNSAGHVVGISDDDFVGGKFEGFLYIDGTLSPIKVPEAYSTYANDINNAGHIVGSFMMCGPTECLEHGFLDVGGTFTTIDVSGVSGRVTFTRPTGINDAGHIVGQFEENGAFKSFLDVDGTFTTIAVPIPGVEETFAEGINNAGMIVGYFHDGKGNHGFVKIGDTYSIIDVPSAYPCAFNCDTKAFGINDAGQIVGVPAPIPEPGSLVLFSVGLLGLGLAWRQRVAALPSTCACRTDCR